MYQCVSLPALYVQSATHNNDGDAIMRREQIFAKNCSLASTAVIIDSETAVKGVEIAGWKNSHTTLNSNVHPHYQGQAKSPQKGERD